MPTFNVEGVGPIELPDGMTDDEISEAISAHPQVQKYQSTHPGGWQELGQNALAAGGEFAMGLPVVGQMAYPTVNDSPETQQHWNQIESFEHDYPRTAAFSRALGDTLGTVGGALALPWEAPEWATAQGVKLLGEKYGPGVAKRLTQGTSLSGLNMADTAAHDVSQEGRFPGPQEFANDAMLGYGTAAVVNPLMEKILSPRFGKPDTHLVLNYLNEGLPESHKIDAGAVKALKDLHPDIFNQDLMEAKDMARFDKDSKWFGPMKYHLQKGLEKTGEIPIALATGGLSHLLGGNLTTDLILGTLGGMIGKPFAEGAANKGMQGISGYLNNELAKGSTGALLRALIAGGQSAAHRSVNDVQPGLASQSSTGG